MLDPGRASAVMGAGAGVAVGLGGEVGLGLLVGWGVGSAGDVGMIDGSADGAAAAVGTTGAGVGVGTVSNPIELPPEVSGGGAGETETVCDSVTGLIEARRTIDDPKDARSVPAWLAVFTMSCLIFPVSMTGRSV